MSRPAEDESVINVEGHSVLRWSVDLVPRNDRLAIWFLLAFLAMAIGMIATSAVGENTPPLVVVDTPQEGANLALMVTISGTASDTEGFNTSSYVEARWNDWEWFRLPSNAGQEGHILHYGEIVNLDWHTPGAHQVHVRAFDGELHSGIVTVNVTVRDLPDIVILPTDITLEPEHARAAEDTRIWVQVRNQGGEEVEEVEVVVTAGGDVVGTKVISSIGPYSEGSVSLEWTFGEGNVTIVATARSLKPIQEKSTANNQADRTIKIREEATSDVSWQAFALVMGALGLFFILVLVAMAVRPADGSRKD